MMEGAGVLPSGERNAAAVMEPTLADIVRDLWRAKFVLVCGAVIGFALAFVFMALAVPHYRAMMIVGPADRQGGVDMRSVLPSNSSFAVQYLMDTISPGDSPDFMRFEQILREPSVAARLMAAKDLPAGVSDVAAKLRDDKMLRLSGGNDLQNNAAEVSDYLQKHVHVEPVGTTPMKKIVFDHPDPAFALWLVQYLHRSADAMIRQDMEDTAAKREAYLKEAMEHIFNPDHRKAFTALLMEQEHLHMMLAMDGPFAAVIAEPASVSAKPVWPKAGLVYPVFIFAGMFAAYMMRAIVQTIRGGR